MIDTLSTRSMLLGLIVLVHAILFWWLLRRKIRRLLLSRR